MTLSLPLCLSISIYIFSPFIPLALSLCPCLWLCPCPINVPILCVASSCCMLALYLCCQSCVSAMVGQPAPVQYLQSTYIQYTVYKKDYLFQSYLLHAPVNSQISKEGPPTISPPLFSKSFFNVKIWILINFYFYFIQFSCHLLLYKILICMLLSHVQLAVHCVQPLAAVY